MAVSPAPPSLEERVDTFVQWLFEDFKPVPPTGPKVFNDALLGHLLFAKHEVAVIDCPVLQRLRRIKQTGLVYYVFPSATHSRFEHSLGAAALSERCYDAIRERAKVEETTFPGDDADLLHLRMAALLHDVGHGLCSHASEQIYKQLSNLQEFKNDKYKANQEGEVLSYLIVTSPTFQKWFEEYVVRGCQVKLDLKVVSDLILGRHGEKDKYFLAKIVSGPFDCDKLDYIARDSYYCGLALTVDLPRFYSMISTERYKDYTDLALRSYVPVEQILFSKMNLFGSVYHHQKVKCVGSMLRSVIGHIAQNPEQAKFPVRGGRHVSFTDPVEYLYATDDEFFSQAGGFGDEYTKNMLSRFRNRNLFVRCLEISRRTVTNWQHYGRQKLIDLTVLPEKLLDLENKIHASLPPADRAKSNRDDVRLSVPGIPPLSGEALIRTYRGASAEKIKKYFPVSEWIQSYAHNKWRSYVYAPREVAPAVRDAAISVLLEYSGLKIDANMSNQTCHL